MFGHVITFVFVQVCDDTVYNGGLGAVFVARGVVRCALHRLHHCIFLQHPPTQLWQEGRHGGEDRVNRGDRESSTHVSSIINIRERRARYHGIETCKYYTSLLKCRQQYT